MKKFLLLTLVLLQLSLAYSQNLIIQHNNKGSFLVHAVAPKETFYSLGRAYNIPPKDIASFNNIEMERGLNIGQNINIPLNTNNFSQEKADGLPVYYVVGEKEGLYRVSVNNNKVLMANLRKWNDLRSDAVSVGQKLVVGYLKSTDVGLVNNTKPKVPEKQDYAKMPEENEVKEPVKKDTEKPVQVTSVTEKTEQPKNVQATVNSNNGGYFKSAFDVQIKVQPLKKDESVTAGIFKTASGWQDAKYYALIDGVEPGTIIRIINPNNNKAVYAKVLDKMTGIRQNQGYNVRISNAAAIALDISDTEKFFVRVNY